MRASLRCMLEARGFAVSPELDDEIDAAKYRELLRLTSLAATASDQECLDLS